MIGEVVAVLAILWALSCSWWLPPCHPRVAVVAFSMERGRSYLPAAEANQAAVERFCSIRNAGRFSAVREQINRQRTLCACRRVLLPCDSLPIWQGARARVREAAAFVRWADGSRLIKACAFPFIAMWVWRHRLPDSTVRSIRAACARREVLATPSWQADTE